MKRETALRVETDRSPRTAASRRARVLGVIACAGVVLLCEALVFRYLFEYGVSNVWSSDGATQHFPALMYFHQWMTAVLSGHGASYGAWSWHLGLGADAFTTLSYYLADPFAFLSLLFPVALLQYVYEGLLFVKVLCAGLAGYLYLRKMRATQFAAIAGTLVYVFANFTLQATLRHPYFADPMIWFSLILLGVEQVLQRKRWYLLAGMLCVAAVSNFYFFYQLGIVAIIYAVVRYVEVTERGRRLRRLLREGLRIGGWYALGTALAAFALLPLWYASLASSRVAYQYGMSLFYNAHTYLTYLVALASVHGGANSLAGGFAVLGFLAAIVVFMRRGSTALKAMLVAMAVFLVFPFFGRMFNAFTFPSYRFFFMAGLFLAAATAIVLSDKRALSRRELAVTGIAFAIFAALDMWAARQLGYRLLLVAIPLIIGALTWALFAVERLLSDRDGGARGDNIPARVANRNRWLRWGVMALLVAGIAAAGVGTYSERYSTILKSYLPVGTAVSKYTTDPGSQAGTLPTSGLQRVDKQASTPNDELVEGFAGIGFYYSLESNGMVQYPAGLADRGQSMPFEFRGFDDRAALDTLNGVRYYIAPDSGEQYVPYGFTRFSTLGTETVYENRYALPVGYVYHSVVASATYAALPPLDKQQALLQGVVVADDAAPAVPRIQPASETSDVPYTLSPGSGLVWNEASKSVSVTAKDASATLTFAPVPDAELYVQMSGITFSGASVLQVGARATGPLKIHNMFAPSASYYWGDHTALIDLGYFAAGTTHADITFPAKAKVRYTSLNVIAIPMAGYAKQVGALAADGMRDVKVGTDTLSGTVTSHGAGVLFLSIPYSTGWSATVDGVSTPILEANVGFSGIPVTSGTHHVVLRYVTPGLRTGILISVLALLLAIVLVVLTERRLAAVRE